MRYIFMIPFQVLGSKLEQVDSSIDIRVCDGNYIIPENPVIMSLNYDAEVLEVKNRDTINVDKYARGMLLLHSNLFSLSYINTLVYAKEWYNDEWRTIKIKNVYGYGENGTDNVYKPDNTIRDGFDIFGAELEDSFIYTDRYGIEIAFSDGNGYIKDIEFGAYYYLPDSVNMLKQISFTSKYDEIVHTMEKNKNISLGKDVPFIEKFNIEFVYLSKDEAQYLMNLFYLGRGRKIYYFDKEKWYKIFLLEMTVDVEYDIYNINFGVKI